MEAMIGMRNKLHEKVSTTLYDLTHLEINTIIKDEMSGTKAPSSPRLLLYSLASIYYSKLILLGEKYVEYLGPLPEGVNNLFRGLELNLGSGYDSFHELSHRAESAALLIKTNKAILPFSENDLNSDIMMLKRIETISNDVRSILKMVDTVKGAPVDSKETYLFDKKETIADFRCLRSEEAESLELDLDLRQLMVIKKANDIGIEKVVLQTVIGMDGDLTTRISKAFAEQPNEFINDLHHEAIGISVDFWKTLITVVVELGKNFIGMFSNKS
jgi:hypothetical protein